MRIKTHVLLVSSQPTPNVTPVLDDALKPERVVLLTTPDMEQRADWLEAVFRPRGIQVSRVPIADPYDVAAISGTLYSLLDTLEAESPALNVTGGTKLMAIAAYEAFRTADLPIFYVHPERDRVIWLHPTSLPAQDLADSIRLEVFLKAHGVTLNPRPAAFGMAEPLRRLADQLVAHVDKYSQALGTLNWAAMAAASEKSLISPTVERQLQTAEFDSLIHWFDQEGLLTVKKGSLHFADEAARFFANGGWLEQYVYATVQALRKDLPGVQDQGRGLEISRQPGAKPVPNELDVAFLKDNRLYVIECKTRKFNNEAASGSAGAEAVYKLDALKDAVGGLQARAMLVSYRELPATVRDRAAAHRIEVCAAAEIKQLPQRLRRWIT